MIWQSPPFIIHADDRTDLIWDLNTIEYKINCEVNNIYDCFKVQTLLQNAKKKLLFHTPQN